MSKVLGILLEEHSRARPQDWPKYMRVREHHLRHKLRGTGGISPYSVFHGFYGSSGLGAALQQLQEIPLQLEAGDLMRSFMATSQLLEEKYSKWHILCHEAMRLQYKKTLKRATLSVGDIVLMTRPVNEKGVSFKLLSKLKGPYKIKEVHSEHSVSLELCATQEEVQFQITLQVKRAIQDKGSSFRTFRITRAMCDKGRSTRRHNAIAREDLH